MVQLGLRNTLLALIIPQAATAFGLYLLRQSFLGVPKELEEAACIDGCSRLGEWWNVMIPAARADLITLAMFVFIGTWGCSNCPAASPWIGGLWRLVPWCRSFLFSCCSFCCSVSSCRMRAAMP
jgi:ABC-type methionine transport system permease subunit